jgi:aryl-alcohol dehydrogenase-like predicted oxidoreductase
MEMQIPSAYPPGQGDAGEALDAAVRAGEVDYVGFSNRSTWKATALENQRSRVLAQLTPGRMRYLLLGRDVERDVTPMMRRYGLSLAVRNPLASGYLIGTSATRTQAGRSRPPTYAAI